MYRGNRGIYTNVNILEKLLGRRRLEIAGQPDLLEYCNAWIGAQHPTNEAGQSVGAKHSAKNPSSQTEILNPNASPSQEMWPQGRILLLDGLDEVREEDTKRVIRQIEALSDRFPKNHFVIT